MAGFPSSKFILPNTVLATHNHSEEICFPKEAAVCLSLHDPSFMTAVANQISYPRKSIFGLEFNHFHGGSQQLVSALALLQNTGRSESFRKHKHNWYL